jgi:hypothetical protein
MRTRLVVALVATCAVGSSGLSAAPAGAQAASDLGVTAAATPAAAPVGSVVSVTAVVTNHGPEAVGVVDVIASTFGATVVTAGATSGLCVTDVTVTCTAPGLAAGGTITVTVGVRLDDHGPVDVDFDVALLEDVDPNPSNDFASVRVDATGPPASVTLTASRGAVAIGGEVTFVARVTVAGLPTEGVLVTLAQRRSDQTTFTDLGSLFTDAGGTAELVAAPDGTSEFVARVDDTDLAGPATSSPVTVQVSFAVRTVVSPVKIPPGGQLTVTTTVRPASPGAVVTFEERFGAGDWRVVGTGVQSSTGTVRLTLGRRSKVGTYALRVTRAGAGVLVAGVGEGRTVVTVTGEGRASAWRPIAGTKASPHRWGTCRIGYRVNPRRLPPTGMADLREALRRVTPVRRIRFRYDGRTSAVPRAGYSGPGLNKIIVAFVPPAKSGGLLFGPIAGRGGSSHVGTRIRSGYVIINTTYSNTADPGFGAGGPLGLVLMHELGHVLGLDHALDRKQVMEASAALPAAVWGAADLRGLRKVGAHCR